MSFTGSTRAGTAVTCDAAETVKRVTLELGGKSPNLVFADCDLEERVIASVDECMFNTGQSCDAPQDCWLNVLVMMMSLVLQSEQLNRQMLATQLRKGTILVLYLTSFNLSEFRG